MKIEIHLNNKECEIYINEMAIESNNKNHEKRNGNIIENLFVARKENKLKQRDIASLLNMHEVTYSRKERGEVDFTLNEAFILADFFKTTVDVLFADKKPLRK